MPRSRGKTRAAAAPRGVPPSRRRLRGAAPSDERPVGRACRSRRSRSSRAWRWRSTPTVSAARCSTTTSTRSGTTRSSAPVTSSASSATPSWWGDGRGRLWRPLTTLTFALDHALHGLEPFGYHLVNVVAARGRERARAEGVRRRSRRAADALAAALLFATHPIHTEAVASVVGRAELLAAAGFFLAWRCWLAADAAAARSGDVGVDGGRGGRLLPRHVRQGERGGAPGRAGVRGPAPRRGESSWSALLRRRRASLCRPRGGARRVRRSAEPVIGQVTPTTDLLDNPLSALPLVSRLLTAVEVIGLYALPPRVPALALGRLLVRPGAGRDHPVRWRLSRWRSRSCSVRRRRSDGGRGAARPRSRSASPCSALLSRWCRICSS